MSFFSNIAATFRAVNEGRSTANAHRMAEEFLQASLPADVAADGYRKAAQVADYCSVEQMAMIYVISYANRMRFYLDAVSATQEFRLSVGLNVARALMRFSELQRSGVELDRYQIPQLIAAAKAHGVKTDNAKFALVF